MGGGLGGGGLSGLLSKFLQFGMIFSLLQGMLQGDNAFGGQREPQIRTAQAIANVASVDGQSSSLPSQGPSSLNDGLTVSPDFYKDKVGPDVDGCGGSKSFNSNIDIDTDGRQKRVPGRTELPETSLKLGGQSVNSDKVNFIVMPGNCREHLGKYASVEYRGEKVYGIVADCGPAGKTGEMSTSMAKELSDKLHASGKGQGVPKFVGDGDVDHYKGFAGDGKAKYTILPGEVGRGKPITNDEIRQGAIAQENSVAARCGNAAAVALSPSSAGAGSLAGTGYTF
jgi:hypothetical protein